jgi:replicative DNA helicase
MGKTAVASAMSRNMAIDHGIGVAFFSLEMSERQLLKRMVLAETGYEIPVNKAECEQFIDNATKMFEAPVYIDDTRVISLAKFRDKCRQLVQEKDVKVAIIDYLQLMNWTGDKQKNREQQMLMIVHSLKVIAVELNIAIIALSQLNREVAGREDKRPSLSDFRVGDECIAQFADIVVFIHRPEYYGIRIDSDGNKLPGVVEFIKSTVDSCATHQRWGTMEGCDGNTFREVDEIIESTKMFCDKHFDKNVLRGVAEIIVAKNNNDVLGDLRLKFNREFCKFEEAH